MDRLCIKRVPPQVDPRRRLDLSWFSIIRPVHPSGIFFCRRRARCSWRHYVGRYQSDWWNARTIDLPPVGPKCMCLDHRTKETFVANVIWRFLKIFKMQNFDLVFSNHKLYYTSGRLNCKFFQVSSKLQQNFGYRCYLAIYHDFANQNFDLVLSNDWLYYTSRIKKSKFASSAQ